jgi:hypothetical protein
METLDILVHDPKFWTAVLFLIQTVLFVLVPTFPADLWEALSAVLVIVFGALTLRGTRQEVATRRAARAVRPLDE